MFHMHFQMYMSYHTFFGTVPTSQQKKRESIHYQPLHYNSNLSYKVVDTWREWAGSTRTPPHFLKQNKQNKIGKHKIFYL